MKKDPTLRYEWGHTPSALVSFGHLLFCLHASVRFFFYFVYIFHKMKMNNCVATMLSAKVKIYEARRTRLTAINPNIVHNCTYILFQFHWGSVFGVVTFWVALHTITLTQSEAYLAAGFFMGGWLLKNLYMHSKYVRVSKYHIYGQSLGGSVSAKACRV